MIINEIIQWVIIGLLAWIVIDVKFGLLKFINRYYKNEMEVLGLIDKIKGEGVR